MGEEKVLAGRPIGQRGMVQDYMDEETFAEMIAVCMSAPRDPDRVIYFISDEAGFIKIGFTKDLKKRLSMLRTATKRNLQVLATAQGGRAHEAIYHILFERHRVEGEWFERHPDILAEIDRLNNLRPALRQQSEALHQCERTA